MCRYVFPNAGYGCGLLNETTLKPAYLWKDAVNGMNRIVRDGTVRDAHCILHNLHIRLCLVVGEVYGKGDIE